MCQKQGCEYNGGTQHCKLPKEAHGGDLRFHQFVKGVGDVEHTITLMPGISKSPIKGNHGPESDGSEEGIISEIVSVHGDAVEYQDEAKGNCTS